MNRENNIYVNETGESLSATEMLDYVTDECKRLYKECRDGMLFDDLSIEEQQEMISDQFKWQLEMCGWKFYNNGVRI